MEVERFRCFIIIGFFAFSPCLVFSPSKNSGVNGEPKIDASPGQASIFWENEFVQSYIN